MPSEDDLRAWSRMLSLAPPSVRADPDLHRAWVLRRGQAIVGHAKPRTIAGPAVTAAIASSSSVVPWIVGGVVVLGVSYLVGRWWVRRKKTTQVSGYEALGGNYLVGLDILAAR